MILSIKSRHIRFGLLVFILVLVYVHPLWMLLRFSLDPSEEQYSHILLIPFVAVYLLYQGRKRIFSKGEYHPGWGIGLFLAGLAVVAIRLMIGESLGENDFLSLTIFSFFLFWLASFLFCYGPRALEKGAFPLLFLVLIVPIPDLLLSHTIRFLQYQSAEATAGFFTLTGTTVFRDGLTFYLPGVTILIAEECSGIRSSLALFVTGLLAGHFFLRTNSRKFLLALAIVPLAVLKNGIRIASLTLLSVYVDPGFLSGPLHHRGGFVFFGITLMVMAGILWLLRKSEGKKPAPAADSVAGA